MFSLAILCNKICKRVFFNNVTLQHHKHVSFSNFIKQIYFYKTFRIQAETKYIYFREYDAIYKLVSKF